MRDLPEGETQYLIETDIMLSMKPRKEIEMSKEDRMWEEFNAWHKSRYGWNLRDDRARNSQAGYTGMVAWFAWLEATARACENPERNRND